MAQYLAQQRARTSRAEAETGAEAEAGHLLRLVNRLRRLRANATCGVCRSRPGDLGQPGAQ